MRIGLRSCLMSSALLVHSKGVTNASLILRSGFILEQCAYFGDCDSSSHLLCIYGSSLKCLCVKVTAFVDSNVRKLWTGIDFCHLSSVYVRFDSSTGMSTGVALASSKWYCCGTCLYVHGNKASDKQSCLHLGIEIKELDRALLDIKGCKIQVYIYRSKYQ